jgi:hypothetical protein
METNEISIPVGKYNTLHGNLKIPFGASLLVIFSHGSGSSRFSARNNYVVGILNKEKIATLLTDLIWKVKLSLSLMTELPQRIKKFGLVQCESCNSLPELCNAFLPI